MLRPLPKAVVIHAGRRDSYQLALALDTENLLDTLVTDFYWDERWHCAIQAILHRATIPERYCPGLNPRRVSVSAQAMCATGVMKLRPGLNLHPSSDAALSRKGLAIAGRSRSAIFSYSYCAYQAFRPGPRRPRYRFLFQLHPHHRSVKRYLTEELEWTPQARHSLEGEAEINLRDRQFENLACEPELSNGWVVASSYSAQTLAENGIPLEKVHVVPYGVDLRRYAQRPEPPRSDQPFTVIFVGSLVQRKGLSYLLDAVRALKTKNVRVLLRGRGNIDRDLLGHYGDINLDLKVGVPPDELVHDLHRSDVFALPSLAEGFAHVILEAMACGLPVITTTNTCAPDIMADGSHGFILPIRSASAISEKLAWGLDNRQALAEMGVAAGRQARLFTWERFRAGVCRAYSRMVNDVDAAS